MEDIDHWVRGDRQKAIRLLCIIKETLREPFSGIGKPEPLKRDHAGFWSRRLTQEHRVIYEVTRDAVRFVSARYHY